MKRIVIVGAPGTGKTTLGLTMSAELGIPLISTDDTMQLYAWSEHSAYLSSLLSAPDTTYVMEGTATVRALRKVLEAGTQLPDLVLYLRTVHADRGPKATSMGKGIATVWAGIEAQLVAAGVIVSYVYV